MKEIGRVQINVLVLIKPGAFVRRLLHGCSTTNNHSPLIKHDAEKMQLMQGWKENYVDKDEHLIKFQQKDFEFSQLKLSLRSMGS